MERSNIDGVEHTRSYFLRVYFEDKDLPLEIFKTVPQPWDTANQVARTCIYNDGKRISKIEVVEIIYKVEGLFDKEMIDRYLKE